MRPAERLLPDVVLPLFPDVVPLPDEVEVIPDEVLLPDEVLPAAAELFPAAAELASAAAELGAAAAELDPERHSWFLRWRYQLPQFAYHLHFVVRDACTVYIVRSQSFSSSRFWLER